MRALYISHNGMLEGLGRSQVLGYVRGLARTGIEFDLLSYELASATDDELEALRAELAADNIRYHPLRRTRGRGFATKVRESAGGVMAALVRAAARRPAVVHGRSYLPTAVADVVATLLPRARLLFDCRGMLGDEYVDAGYWTPDRFEYRLLKRYERHAFRRADGVVVLTNALRRWLEERAAFGEHTRVEAIPCCVDLEAFVHVPAARQTIRRELGWAEDDVVVVYSGSLGSWYREPDIARFVEALRRRTPASVRFLLLTTSPTSELVDMVRRAGLSADSVATRSLRSNEMSAYLSAADIGLSFIKSCFSKTGSSPTKVAEYLACGLPVVLNGDIGDQDELRAEHDACVVVDGWDETAMTSAADRALRLAARPVVERLTMCRHVAIERFGLERVGVPRYARLYAELARDGNRGGAGVEGLRP